MADEPQLWRYTAGEKAEPWVKGRGLLLAAAFAVPFYEAKHNLTVTGPATLDEAAALTAVVGPGHPARYLKRMVQVCRDDKTWKDALAAEDHAAVWERGVQLLILDETRGR